MTQFKSWSAYPIYDNEANYFKFNITPFWDTNNAMLLDKNVVCFACSLIPNIVLAHI